MASTKQKIDRWSASEKTTLNVTPLRNSPTPKIDLSLTSSMSTNDDSNKNSGLIITNSDNTEHLNLPETTLKTISPARSTPITSEAMTQQVLRLAEKINDQYLTCKICLEPFKEPKCLTCLHTFCEQCIESHVSAQR
ncbi:unnamed protein product [Rotaria sp. Silwood1]|nr:unnamed protein product [Rotaria sp. Silwood1]